MYECLIKKYNDDGSVSYEYYSNQYGAIPKEPHIQIPEGAEYLILHEGTEEKQLIFYKDNFNWMWSISYDETDWCDCNWGNIEGNKLEYMKHVYDSVVLWKREDVAMNENIYLLTKLQACEIILSRNSVLQYQSTDGNWVDFKSNANKSNAQLYVILFHLDDTKFRIKPEWEHIPIEFFEVVEMLIDNRGNEVFINKEVNLEGAENPLLYLQRHYHNKYSRAVEKQLTYDQWKNCKKGEWHE